MSCAAAISSPRPPRTGCCSGCSASPSPRYRHHRLVLDGEGEKMSKSAVVAAARGAARRGRDGESDSRRARFFGGRRGAFRGCAQLTLAVLAAVGSAETVALASALGACAIN